jgi:hypothetical protein
VLLFSSPDTLRDMRTTTAIQHAQLCNLAPALLRAFEKQDSPFDFLAFPFETQMSLEDALARKVRRGTTDLVASAVEVADAWVAQ